MIEGSLLVFFHIPPGGVIVVFVYDLDEVASIFWSGGDGNAAHKSYKSQLK